VSLHCKLEVHNKEYEFRFCFTFKNSHNFILLRLIENLTINRLKQKSQYLKLAIFATGVSGIVAEYILSTLASYFIGNSVLQWSMIMSTMLFSMGLGSRISKYFKTELLIKFIFIEFTLSVFVSLSSLVVYTGSIFSDANIIIIYSLSIIIGLMIGMEIPLVIRINENFQSLRTNISSIMENDYYGSLLGGVFFSFIGLPFLGLTYTPFVLGFVNFTVAIVLIIALWNIVAMKKLVIVLSISIGIILVGAIFFAKPIIRFGEQKKYKDLIVYSEQSKYQKIIITQHKNDYWLYINGNQQLSSFDEEMYHEPLVHPVMKLHPIPKNVLVMGGGDGCAVREILKYKSVKQITLVDLDPAMTNLGKENPILIEMNHNSMNSDKLKIINTDAYNFIENSDDYFDVIIIDLPDPKTIELGRLYSYEFYKKCFNKLRKFGCIVTQAGSPYFAPDAFKCINKTMKEAGFSTAPIHNQVVTLGEWGWVIGVKGTHPKNLKSTLQNINFEGIETSWINHEAMKLLTSFGKEFFKTGLDSVEINRVHNSVLKDYYMNGAWEIY
jgi:spermidine synthase